MELAVCPGQAVGPDTASGAQREGWIFTARASEGREHCGTEGFDVDSLVTEHIQVSKAAKMWL